MCFMELSREPSQHMMRFPLESIGVHWSPLELQIWNEYNEIPIGVHWSPLESIGVEDLTCMLVESIGVGDLVEFVPKKDLH